MNRPPNIVVLLADQLRPFELGCYGHPFIPTPNIDRLAAMGVRFDVACTPNPVCTPARSALLSGQYSRTCIGMLGCCGDPSERRGKFPDTTLPELLSIGSEGHETMLCGKWHVESNPLRLGFESAFYPLVNHLNVGQTYFDGKGASWVVGGYCPDAEVATSCDFLRKPHDRPYFLFHNLALPHMPFFDMPARYRERFSRDQVMLRPNVYHDGKPWHDDDAFNIYWHNWLYMQKLGPQYEVLPDGFDLRTLTALYYGMVTAVDDQVGSILDCIEQSGQIENTVIVFASDHGENLGSHWLWNKVSVNDEAIRVPFIVAWPGSAKPRVVTDHVASLVDLAPTLLDLAGRSIPAHIHGRSLAPVITGNANRVGDGTAIIENLHGEVAVRTPTHLFSVMTRTQVDTPARQIVDDESLFYDLRTDPYQMHNLAGTDSQRDVANLLRERAITWDASTPWMPISHGGVYGQGPQHDLPPRVARSFGILPTASSPP